jgi:hypothetical protein
MSPLKEPHYLADEIRLDNFSDELRRMAEPQMAGLRAYLDGPMTAKFSQGFVTEMDDYLQLFHNSKTEPVLGEASVCYLWSPTAPGNIARMCPEARIVMVLRNPADRAYSQYLQLRSFSRDYLSFRDYIDAGVRYRGDLIGPLHPFLNFGLYSDQVTRYLKHFPRKQIKILFFEDYQSNPLGLVQDIFEFLGVARGFVPDMTQRHMEPKIPRSALLYQFVRPLGGLRTVKRMTTPRLRHSLKRLAFRPRTSMTMDPGDRAFLVDFYREDVLNLSHLLNRDLSAWL